MKRISIFICGLTAMMLAGCTVNPSVLGNNNIATIGESVTSTTTSEISTTGSIVPAGSEAGVVDLPDAATNMARNQMQASTTYQPDETQSPDDRASGVEQPLGDDERHRRELINRGDLQEGQALPVE